jgi:hypothetical protein
MNRILEILRDAGYIKEFKRAILMLPRNRSYLKPKINSVMLFELRNAVSNIPRLSHRPQLSLTENVNEVGFHISVIEPLIDVVPAKRSVFRME